MLTRLAQKLRPGLASPRLVVRTMALVALLSVPTLFHGFTVDDHFLRGFLLRVPPFAQWAPPPLDLFRFFNGDPARTRSLTDGGFAAWWTDPDLRIALFRPLTCFTHGVDFTLWPRLPLLMHVHEVAWYLALVAAAAALFRRVLGAGWPAGFAFLLYALDPTHGVLIEWISNRNALVAATFGVLSLVLHDRARRPAGTARPGLALASAACLALGLLGGELALGAAGYLVAHALFLDNGRPRARLTALTPHLIVLVAWVVFYRAAGYGASGSGVYVDPGQSPLRFLAVAARNVPLLLQTEIGGISPDILIFVQHPSPLIYVGASALVGALLLAAAPLRHDPRARYLFTGAMLSTLPGAATFPSGRLMLLPGLGLLGLVALVAEGVFDRTRTWKPGLPRWAALYVGGWAGGVRLLLSPLLLVATSHQLIVLEHVIARYGEGLGDDPALARQRVVIVNAPDAFFSYYVVAQRHAQGRVAPDKLLVLAPGVRAVEIERRDASTLLVRSEEGFYRGGSELLTRSLSTPMPVGTRVPYSDLTVEVTRTDAAGVPTEALFRFDKPLEDASLRWVAWRGLTFAPFPLPAVGEAQRIEAQTPALW
jgi:hypothetical protein